MAEKPDIPSSEKPPQPPRRQPFEGQAEPEPFRSTRDFQRLVWLGGALVVVAVMGFLAFSRATNTDSRQKVTAAPPPLTAEERAAREQLLKSLFEGSLADTRNGEGFVETQGFRHLLEILARYPAEEVARLASKKLDWTASTDDPDAWRGQFVWTRGVIAHRWAERLKNPVSGITDVYRVILTDGDGGSDGLIVDMIDEPPPVGLQSQPVDVQGIFYRTVRYATAKPYPTSRRDGKGELPPHRIRTPEGDVQEMPYLLVKTMRPVLKPDRDVGGFLRNHGATALIAMAIVIGVARLLIYVFQRRSRRRGPIPKAVGFRKLFDQRIHEKNRTAGPRSES